MRRFGVTRLAVLALAAAAALMAAVVAPSAGDGAAARSATELPSQRCFGAASRDPARRCVNRELRHTVVPMPEEAKRGQNSPCTPGDKTEELYPCHFGVPVEQATRTIVLVGDSHAAHWRAAVDVVARQRRWHGISLTQTGCPLTQAIPILRGQQRDDCLSYNKSIGPWLERHPEVSLVISSQHGPDVVTRRGQSQREAQLDGFTRAFRALPRSIEKTIVIRDTPWSASSVPSCVEKALIERRRPAGAACALPRSQALRPDLAAVAAKRLRSARVDVIDMTPFMCGRTKCFPVVGGALVHKDGGHITQVFSRTLGPYLGRYLRRVVPTDPG